LNEAYTAKEDAEKAITVNEEAANVVDLVNALRDAQQNIITKELALARLHEFQHKLSEELQKLEKDREDVLADRLTADLAVSEGEFEGLNEIYKTAKKAKDDYDTRETELRDARTAMDDPNSGATQAQKDDADQALADHQNTK
jgi:hypothetical protein